MSSRIIVDGNRIYIASKKVWPLVIFWGIWLVMWSVGGIAAFIEVMRDKPGPPLAFSSAFLIVWAVVGLGAALFWLWFAFGREIITVTEDKLTLRNEILGYGRDEVFPLARVTNLRASGLFGSFYTWSAMLKIYGLTGGVVAFECDGRTHRFGKLLEETEADEIVKQLRNQIR